jgi:alcohol dehydrogenase class IV
LYDLGARSECLYGAWLCGAVLGTVGMALHHKLCHVLGGTWNLPHAETHTLVLPHTLAYNRSFAPEAACQPYFDRSRDPADRSARMGEIETPFTSPR